MDQENALKPVILMSVCEGPTFGGQNLYLKGETLRLRTFGSRSE
jgi:hypothetical protein